MARVVRSHLVLLHRDVPETPVSGCTQFVLPGWSIPPTPGLSSSDGSRSRVSRGVEKTPHEGGWVRYSSHRWGSGDPEWKDQARFGILSYRVEVLVTFSQEGTRVAVEEPRVLVDRFC